MNNIDPILQNLATNMAVENANLNIKLAKIQAENVELRRKIVELTNKSKQRGGVKHEPTSDHAANGQNHH